MYLKSKVNKRIKQLMEFSKRSLPTSPYKTKVIPIVSLQISDFDTVALKHINIASHPINAGKSAVSRLPLHNKERVEAPCEALSKCKSIFRVFSNTSSKVARIMDNKEKQKLAIGTDLYSNEFEVEPTINTIKSVSITIIYSPHASLL